MIYPPRDSFRRKRKHVATSLGLGILLVIVVLVNYFIPHAFSTLTHAIGVPLIKSRLAAIGGIFDTFQITRSKKSLFVENKTLRERMLLFEALEVEQKALKSENELLRTMLGRSTSTVKVILGEILSKPGFSPYDTIIVDVGTKDGIEVGDYITVDNTIIIGEIASVTPGSSNALLYSSPEYKTEVFVGTESIQAVAIGKGGGNFEIRVPRNTDFDKGDEVRLTKFPHAIFGSITEIKGAAADSFDRVLFRSLVDVERVRFVTIQKRLH
jgi:cell shape-determining protein MreC